MKTEARGTILIVDETADIAGLLRGVLTEAGYRVLVAATVTMGLQILAAFRVGLVLADVLRIAADNADVAWANLDRLAHAARATPLILCAPDEQERSTDYAAHGFAARLVKPLDLDELLALVGSLLPPGGEHPSIVQGPATTSER